MPWKSVVVAVALVVGAANTTTAFGRGMAGGGAHFSRGGFVGHGFAFGHGFAGRRFALGHRFVRGFRRNFIPGGLWLYYPYPTDAYGGMDTATYPGTADVAPEPIPAPVCRRSEEIFRVPAEGGGTRQIKVTNCPSGL